MNSTVPIRRLEKLTEDEWTTQFSVNAPETAEHVALRDSQRSHLRLASQTRRKARRAPLSPVTRAVIAIGVILGIFITQLGMSILTSEGAYEQQSLELQQRDLGRVERLLQLNVDKLASPQNLAENAVKLGMVQNVQPAVLRLSDAAILGSLKSQTAAPQENQIANATLSDIPAMDASGAAPSAVSQHVTETPKQPVPWKKAIPVPDTH